VLIELDPLRRIFSTNVLPFAVNRCEDLDIKGLSFMSCLRRETQRADLDVFIIEKLVDYTLNFKVFMRAVSIHRKDDWLRVIHTAFDCKWDEDLFEPLSVIVRICPSSLREVETSVAT